MIILINGSQVIPKKGVSFDFVTENPFFTDADSYSLNITFPLRGCAENARVFGPMNRHGHSAEPLPFDMEIIDGGQRLSGYGVATSVSESEVKVQFLGNISAQNYKCDLDEVYINDLNLGSLASVYRWAESCTVAQAWAGVTDGGIRCVCIPWVNEDTGNMQNDVRLVTDDEWAAFEADGTTVPGMYTGADRNLIPGGLCCWNIPEEVTESPMLRYGLSWMPYLIDIAQTIARKAGFTWDFSTWQSSKWASLLLCNAVPYTWSHDWRFALPDWSVLEFFQKLEPLLEGHFDIDLRIKKITFAFYRNILNASQEVTLPDVIDEFSSDIYDEEEFDECNYLPERFMGYKFGDTDIEKLYDCQWFVDRCRKFGDTDISEHDTAEDVYEAANNPANQRQKWKFLPYTGNTRESAYVKLHYLKSADRYFSIKASQQTTYLGTLDGKPWMPVDVMWGGPQMVNQFGQRNIPDKESDKDSPTTEIEFIPARLLETDFAKVVFISPGTYDEEVDATAGDFEFPASTDEDTIPQSWPVKQIVNETNKSSHNEAYFSSCSVGFYPDPKLCNRYSPVSTAPLVDWFDFDFNFRAKTAPTGYTLSLRSEDGKFSGWPRVDSRRKFEFSWLASEIPDVKGIFHIRGHRYLCESITASFSEYGMSQMLKGTFWRILD